MRVQILLYVWHERRLENLKSTARIQGEKVLVDNANKVNHSSFAPRRQFPGTHWGESAHQWPAVQQIAIS
jgi:hypothetical protein